MSSISATRPRVVEENLKKNQLDRSNYSSDNEYVAAVLAQHGLSNQTRINEAGGEATYVDYAGALSPEMLAAISNGGFGETDGLDEAELAIRNNIAQLYEGRSVIQTNDLIKMLSSMGYKVSSQYMSTTYISDNKNDGRYDTDVWNASICVLTITDKDGNDIVIADANGNAAIEVEELFIDEIVSGATQEIANMGDRRIQAGEINHSQLDYNLDYMYSMYDTMSFADKVEYGFGFFEEQEPELFKDGVDKLTERANRMREAQKAAKEKAKAEEKNALEKAKEWLEELLDKEENVTQDEYQELEAEYKDEYIEELLADDKNSELSESEIEELAAKEAKKYMEDNYKIIK